MSYRRPPSPARRRPVPHRRRHRDRPDLPRGARPAGVRGVRPAQGRRTARRRCGATTTPYLDARARATGSGSCSRARPGAPARAGRPQLGYTEAELDALNRRAIALMEELRDADAGRRAGRDQRLHRAAGRRLQARRARCRADAARDYHATQIETFADTAADMVTRDHDDLRRRGDRASSAPRARPGMPAAISFTVETDGRLPSGQSLADAIELGRRGRRPRPPTT